MHDGGHAGARDALVCLERAGVCAEGHRGQHQHICAGLMMRGRLDQKLVLVGAMAELV